jgi:molybdate transport system substrate-binding protein
VALVKRCCHVVLALFLLLPAVLSAQVNHIMSGGFAVPYKEVLPSFENKTGISVTTTGGASQGTGPNAIGAQLRRGLPADVVIINREGLTDLAAEGRLVPGSIVDIARVPIGLAVLRGAPKPDVSTLEGFKNTLHDARAIASASSATIYLTTKLLPALGMD